MTADDFDIPGVIVRRVGIYGWSDDGIPQLSMDLRVGQGISSDEAIGLAVANIRAKLAVACGMPGLRMWCVDGGRRVVL